MQDSFVSWYDGGGLKKIVVDGPYGGDTHCECSPYARACGTGPAAVGRAAGEL